MKDIIISVRYTEFEAFTNLPEGDHQLVLKAREAAMGGHARYFPCIHYCIFGPQKPKRMTFSVQVKVMPLKELLDPQGKAVMGGLGNLGLNAITDVRIGKNITLQVEAADGDEARSIAEQAAKKLLANPVMEQFEITIN